MTMATRRPPPKLMRTGIPGYDPVATAGDAWFDHRAARRVLEWFPRALRHVEGDTSGQPFTLRPWQAAILGNLFGWLRYDARGRIVRRYRKALLYVPRKNGKTPLAAGIGLYVLFTDPERGQQGYIAACNREQAGFLFRHAKGMVEAHPALRAAATVFGGASPVAQSRSIVRDCDGSFLRVLSADAESKHGGNLSLGIVDELHAQPNRDLVDVLTTSMASAVRPSPLLLFLTTADYDRPSVCNEVYEYARRVRDGVIDDPTFLPVIYEAEGGDDWTAPSTWRKANPNYGVTVSEDYLRAECRHAREEPAFEPEFKRLHLNLRTEQSRSLIPLAQWDACAEAFSLDEFAGQPCWAGLDMSSTNDLTALAVCFRRCERRYLAAWHWAPRATADLREQGGRRARKAPYHLWARHGFLTICDEPTIDQAAVRETIRALARRFDLRLLGIDPWNARHFAALLHREDGLPIVEFRQGYASMNEPTKQFLALVARGALRHDGNPLLRWQAGNMVGVEDGAGNLKPDKPRSADKIDGLVASIMAVALSEAAPVETPEIHLL